MIRILFTNPLYESCVYEACTSYLIFWKSSDAFTSSKVFASSLIKPILEVKKVSIYSTHVTMKNVYWIISKNVYRIILKKQHLFAKDQKLKI